MWVATGSERKGRGRQNTTCDMRRPCLEILKSLVPPIRIRYDNDNDNDKDRRQVPKYMSMYTVSLNFRFKVHQACHCPTVISAANQAERTMWI